MRAVVGLTFLFGFGNVWALVSRLGVSEWVAPLVAPAVDLSVMALLLGTRYIALRAGTAEHLHPARRLLVHLRVLTLALNVTDPLIAGHFGKATFDAVGPLLLIGWAEIGPGLLHDISAVTVGRETLLRCRVAFRHTRTSNCQLVRASSAPRGGRSLMICLSAPVGQMRVTASRTSDRSRR